MPVGGNIPPPRIDWARGVGPKVAKQHEEFVRTIAFGILASARACLWLDEITRKVVERLNEDFPQTRESSRVLPTDIKIVFPLALTLAIFFLVLVVCSCQTMVRSL